MSLPTRTGRSERDFVLQDAEFEQIRQLVRQHSGIALSES